MTEFPKERLELVKQDFSRTRDQLSAIYQTGVEYIQNGLRETSTKQYNLNLSLLSIIVVMIGVVIPIIVLQPSLIINHEFLGWSTYCFIASFLLGLAVSIYAPYQDRIDLNIIWKAQQTNLKNLQGMVKNILFKAENETLTKEDINKYNEDSTKENEEFAKNTKLNKHRLLNFLYYSFLGVFILGLVIFILALKTYLF
jgi:hypothetical protein